MKNDLELAIVPASTLKEVRLHLNKHAVTLGDCFRLESATDIFLFLLNKMEVVCTLCPGNKHGHPARIALNAPATWGNVYTHLISNQHKEVYTSAGAPGKGENGIESKCHLAFRS